MIVLTKPTEGSSNLCRTIAKFLHIFGFVMAQYRELMVVWNPWQNVTLLDKVICDNCVHSGLCMVMSSVEDNACAVGVDTDHAQFDLREAL